MHMCEQWWCHCTSQWGWWRLLSEHVYCVAVTFKMTERVEERICIRLCVKLEHSSSETILMILQAAALGSWWLAASSRQYAHSCITSPAEIFGKTSNLPGNSAPLQPRRSACNYQLFSKVKSPLKKRRFQTLNEIQENTMGQLMVIRTVWGPKVPTLKGTEVSLFYI